MTATTKIKSQKNGRLSWLDILKGIGIILVAVGHIYSNKIIGTWLYSFHMPLFFMATGYTYREKPILQDIKHRFQTIVVPYFSFGLLVLLYWVVFERRFRESSMTPFESLIGLLRGQYSYLDFNVHFWFLPCFFTTAVLFNVLVSVGRKIELRLENSNKPRLTRGVFSIFGISRDEPCVHYMPLFQSSTARTAVGY